MTAEILAEHLRNGDLDSRLSEIYGTRGIDDARARLLGVADRYGSLEPDGAAALFTAAGRTEMGGNHTDHQHGRVLAASVSLDTVACGGANGSNEIRVLSEGYPDVVVDISELNPVSAERESSEAIVRGIARGITRRGHEVHGATIVTSSNVPGGSGLSSSAAFEILVGTALNHLFCDDSLSPLELAQIGKYAENVYFGKPSGLMDQMACATGGVISIDFADPSQPEWETIPFDDESFGHALCIIDSGADHADLTYDYASIVDEMSAVARFFGKQYLREVDPEEFWRRLPEVRTATFDRAVLRAVHFFDDDARVPAMARALAEGRVSDFLDAVNESGISSATHLQNLYSMVTPHRQAVGVAIAAAQRLLAGRGAVRVHGGGFAGTVQAYVPLDFVDEFTAGIDAMLGDGSCQAVRIRPVGGAVIA